MTATFLRLIRGTFVPKPRPGNRVEVGVGADGIVKYYMGASRQLVDNWNDQTVAGAKTLTGTTVVSGAVTLSGTNTISGNTTFSGTTVGLRGTFTTTTANAVTVEVTDTGRTWFCTASSGTQTFTLPATVEGLTYTFVAGHADGEINISPAAADKITGKGIGGADDGDIKNTAASNAVGDAITLVGDGADGWVVTSMLGTWATV